MNTTIRPGSVLGFDDEALWVVISIDDGRALCADLLDGLRCMSFDASRDRKVLPQAEADALLAAIRRGAEQLDARAARLEEEARSARVGAERARVQLEIVERLRAGDAK